MAAAPTEEPPVNLRAKWWTLVGAACIVLTLRASETVYAQNAPITLDNVLPQSPLNPVTTSIANAYPTAPWLDAYSAIVKPSPATTFALAPGYYRFSVESYCLHAGAYAPTAGSGYLVAPLKGTRAATITGIIAKSAQHPEIPQQDVQRFIWGIEAGARFSDYPPDFRARGLVQSRVRSRCL